MLKQFRNFFPNVKSDTILSNSLFVNPFLKEDTDDLNIHNKLNIDNKLFSTLKEVEQRFLEIDEDSKNNKEQNSRRPDRLETSKDKENLAYIDGLTSKDSYSNNTVLVLDSISHLCTIFDEKDVLRFINLLSLSKKQRNQIHIYGK
jgi:intein/homing endonuclease